MTFRLVTLMSVVLLLSLAAFGLLMAHYQDQVMAEVANTVSAVGQATLLELRGGRVGQSGEGTVMFWRDRAPGGAGDEVSGGRKAGAPGTTVTRMVLTHGEVGEGGTVERVVTETRDVERVVTGAQDVERVGFAQRIVVPGDDKEITIVGSGFDGPEGCGPASVEDARKLAMNYFIKVEEVRAESDPARGLVLKIPRFTPTAEAPAGDAAVHWAYADGEDGSMMATREEIRLPIPVRHYEELFDAIRGRSLFLFLGVFLVGTVLSTGLASHFTRPIRKLDGAIRQLSEGDLDVSVPVKGRDEIGRLSRAFNEMAGKLRANRQRAREMVRREKLSALGRMAAGVAHDVRNPLHSIGLTLQHLRETSRPGEPERAAEFDGAVEIIRGEVRRLDQLIDNFLRFAKSERHERVPVDLGELLRETARLVHKEAERRRVQLELDLDEATPHVLADGEALRSAILNLVLNSFEAMPGGGELTVKLRGNGDEVRLEVTDTGEGIPEEDRERVFEFAYTTRDGGNGLGLAMVHHCVVEEHGGRVSLDSTPGEGTRVRLVLPIGEAVAA